jgi:AraC-like DNA-binding protein
VNRDLALGSDRVLQRALAELDKDDVEARVRRAIIDALPSGAPREAQIARSLHMGARTLQRKLHERGTSFSRLLEQVRRELAAQYVADARVPVIEISYLLGFSEPSAFSRAFKRWTGASPAVFRERAC